MRKTLVIADEVFAQRFYPIVLGKDVVSDRAGRLRICQQAVSRQYCIPRKKEPASSTFLEM
jgi:hypothetical protein